MQVVNSLFLTTQPHPGWCRARDRRSDTPDVSQRRHLSP